jgi:hypothetical protein
MSAEQITPDGAPIALTPLARRRKLLPWWVLVFTWMFLIFGAAVPVAIILGILKYNFQLSLLGISTYDPLSLTGLFLIILFAFKAVVAVGLWTEKTWAVKLAQLNAVLSIVVCCFAMIYPWFVPQEGVRHFSLRLELLVIIPYYIKMQKVHYDWEYFNSEPVPESTAFTEQ